MSNDIRLQLKNLWRSITGFYHLTSYSQEGEDRILVRLLEGQAKGFYVDIGAHHPVRFSNTYLFYRQGWSGINIDANPGSKRSFDKRRSRDVNIESGVGPRTETRPFYHMSDPALNSFDADLSQSRDKSDHPFRIVRTSQVEIRPLADILAQYLPAGSEIDFMSVDVEGLDFEVIQSNDWINYRPKYVLIECLATNFEKALNSKVSSFLADKGYEPIAKTVNTLFFKRN